MNKTTTCRRA